MKKSDFYFELPKELIAQTPLEKRDDSRLLLLDKRTGETAHRHFYELPEYLRAGDCLVLNDSRVLPARLLGRRETSGGVCEVLLLTDKGGGLWECLVKPGRRIRPGAALSFGGGALTATVEAETGEGGRLVRFHCDGIFLETLERLGEMPLPPYITHKLEDKTRYQTVYAKYEGSAAAPTAGLHFTKELLNEIEKKGVEIAYVTLHVGLGTFRPVKADNILEHHMHSEYYQVSARAADKINKAKESGHRVICVGTTSCRTIESAADEHGRLYECNENTSIFIYPGYNFKITDALITNFHLPESTLVMLVSALAGRNRVLNAYEKAIQEKYRFFSFGDAMFIY